MSSGITSFRTHAVALTIMPMSDAFYEGMSFYTCTTIDSSIRNVAHPRSARSIVTSESTHNESMLGIRALTGRSPSTYDVGWLLRV